jgi:hypothetical protein
MVFGRFSSETQLQDQMSRTDYKYHEKERRRFGEDLSPGRRTPQGPREIGMTMLALLERRGDQGPSNTFPYAFVLAAPPVTNYLLPAEC